MNLLTKIGIEAGAAALFLSGCSDPVQMHGLLAQDCAVGMNPAVEQRELASGQEVIVGGNTITSEGNGTAKIKAPDNGVVHSNGHIFLWDILSKQWAQVDFSDGVHKFDGTVATRVVVSEPCPMAE